MLWTELHAGPSSVHTLFDFDLSSQLMQQVFLQIILWTGSLISLRLFSPHCCRLGDRNDYDARVYRIHRRGLATVGAHCHWAGWKFGYHCGTAGKCKQSRIVNDLLKEMINEYMSNASDNADIYYRTPGWIRLAGAKTPYPLSPE